MSIAAIKPNMPWASVAPTALIKISFNNMENTIGIIGAGAMGGAVAAGLIEAGIPPFMITLSNPHTQKLQKFDDAGCVVTTDNTEAAKCQRVVVAVKPWLTQQVLEQLSDDLVGSHLMVIAAGVSADQLNKWAPTAAAIDIVMPNTALTVRKSMTFVVPVRGNGVETKEIFDKLGTTQIIAEKELPAAMAVASCGIAYAMRYVRAAMEGAVELGLRATDAQSIICATLDGASALLSQPGTHPEAEIDKVTTPGGITIRGLNAMEANGFTTAVIAGLKASVK